MKNLYNHILCLRFQIVKVGDTNQDGVLDFEEFTQYLRTHEKQLKIMFSSLDRNKDGLLQPTLETAINVIISSECFNCLCVNGGSLQVRSMQQRSRTLYVTSG